MIPSGKTPSIENYSVKLKAFVESVKTLNESRLTLNSNLIILNLFKEAASVEMIHDSEHDLVYRCWDLVSTLLSNSMLKTSLNKMDQESTNLISKMGEYRKAIQNDNSDESILYRRHLASRGRSWLESSYLIWLQNHVRGRRAEIGGIPSIHDERDAMIRLRFKRNETWSLGWLDTNTIPDTAFWAHTYLLIRCGLLQDAVEYVKKHQNLLDGTMDRYFFSYLSAWVNSPNRSLPKSMRDRLLTEWNGHIRDILADPRVSPRGDVFKYTLYKILGRCELSTKNVKCDHVISSTDDYLWLQLVLVREETSKSDPAFEKYTLRDFASKMVGYGQGYFKSLGVYFMVLLLCGEFERAVDLLYRNSNFTVDGLHFAIAFAYLGALRIPNQDSKSMSGGLVSFSCTTLSSGLQYEVATFDFARILLNFIKEWGKSNTLDCLHYAFILGMSFDKPSYLSQQAYSVIRDLILASGQFVTLLGELRPDGSRELGYIEKYKSLLFIKSTKEFVDVIILETAKLSESRQGLVSESLFQQTVQLYHLAEQYEYVISLLNRQLSETLSSREYSIGNNPSTLGSDFPKAMNILDLSEQLLVFYKSRSLMITRISPKMISNCSLLISLHRFMKQVDAGQDDAALLSLERLDIVPLDPDMGVVQRKVEQFRSIDESVARVVPDILVAAMKSIEKLYVSASSTRDTSRELFLQDLRGKAKALLMFAGCVQYRIPGEVFATLNRLDVMMS